MTPFDRALAKGNAATRAANGEPLSMSPMLAGARYKSAVADPARQVRTVIGVFLDGPGVTKISDNTLGRELNTQFVTQPTCAIFHASELLVNGAVVLPKKGDHLRRIDKPGAVYEIQTTSPNGGDGFITRLVQVDP